MKKYVIYTVLFKNGIEKVYTSELENPSEVNNQDDLHNIFVEGNLENMLTQTLRDDCGMAFSFDDVNIGRVKIRMSEVQAIAYKYFEKEN